MRISQVPSRNDFSLESESQFSPEFGTPPVEQTNEAKLSPDDYTPGNVDIPAQDSNQSVPAQSNSFTDSPVTTSQNLGVSASLVKPINSSRSPMPSNPLEKPVDTSSQMVDTQGTPVKTADSQTASQSVPTQPIASSDGLSLEDIPSGWWPMLIVGAIALVVLPLMLFRFVMGTSSANDLERYKFRGPKVKDPDAPNVRGRFKKKPRRNEPKNDEPVSNVGPAASDSIPTENTFTNPDDEIGFLEEVESEFSIDAAPPTYAEIETPELAVELSPDLTSERFEQNDFDLHADEMQNEPLTTNLSSSSFSPKSEPMNDQSDSDLDFDFFSDDDDAQTTSNTVPDDLSAISEPAGVTEEDSVDPFAADAPAKAESVPSSSLNDSEENLVTAMSSSDESDGDFAFFDDDEDEGFSLEDVDAAPAIAVSEAQSAAESEDPVAAEVFATNEAVAEQESQDHTLETAVAATAVGAAAVATTATAKGGSWVKRLFGKRKKKGSVEEIPEDNAIGATAVKEHDDDFIDIEEDVLDLGDVTASEDAQLVDEDMVADAAPIDTTLASTDDVDFSDSSDSFSLEGDESSDGMFEDDSDLDYQFDAEEVQKPEPAQAGSFIEVSDDDSFDDFASMMEDKDDDSPNISVAEEAPSDSFESIELAEEDSQPAGVAASLCGAESASPAEEFNPIGHQSSCDERPLLEDQMLDEIVGSENSLTSDASVAAMAASSNSTDSNDAQLAELQLRIEELESQNATVESERSSLKSELDELREASENSQASVEETQKLAELEKQLDEERQSKQQLEEQLAEEAEAKKLAAEEAEQARAEVESTKAETEKLAAEAEQARAEAETAKAEIEKAATEAELARSEAETAKAEAEKAAAEAADSRQRADEALASVRELEAAAETQSSSAGMLGGSLLAAAGGAVAGASMAGDSGESATADDPFRLEPDQVKVMLKKLKDERQKRRKTKEYFLQVDAQRREVTKTLKEVTGELDHLKLEFQKATETSTDSVSKDTVKELMAKLSAAEDALKKNNTLK